MSISSIGDGVKEDRRDGEKPWQTDAHELEDRDACRFYATS